MRQPDRQQRQDDQVDGESAELPPIEESAASSGAVIAQGLGRSAAAGAAWLTMQKWVVRLSGLVTISILARLVSPEEFGAVAAASSVLPFVLLLSDLGLATYLVQAKDPDQRALSTGFWFSLTAAFVLGGAMFACVPVMVAILNVPEAAPVLRVLLLSVPIVVASAVPSALMRRRMQFKQLAFQGTLGAGIAQVVAIAIAFAGGGAWALVGQAIATTLITTSAAWVTARWLPSWMFSLHEFGRMTRFGYKVVAVELIAVSRAWGETAIIANVLGSAALGYLTIAQRLVQVAQELGGAAIAPVSLVVLAKVRDTPGRLGQAYSKASLLTYGAVTPLLTYLAVAAPVAIPLVFGSQWDESISVTSGLAVAGILSIGAFVDHGLFYAISRPGTWLVYAVITDLVTLGATALFASRGLTAVAWAFVGVALAATVARWFLISRQIDVRVGKLAESFALVGLCAAGSAASGLLVLTISSGPLVVRAVLVGIATVSAHLLLLRVVLPQTFRDAVETVPLPESLRAWLKRLSRLTA